MRRIRLYVDLPLTVGSELELPAAAAEHALRVLRLRVGDPLVLFNGDGQDYATVILEGDRRRARVHVEASQAVDTESPLTLTLAQAVARGDKMDLIVQKATELGVSRIVPLLTERGEVRLDERRADKRLQHWQSVAASACEQCGRARLPAIEPVQALESWLATLPEAGALRLALLPDAGASLATLPASGAAIVVVGPEGGLGDRDVAALRAQGFNGLKLGPRILRTETAGLAALAALQARLGDLAG
jgi:16S rRNA (uracil1498-N3)-methyltransferase